MYFFLYNNDEAEDFSHKSAESITTHYTLNALFSCLCIITIQFCKMYLKFLDGVISTLVN